MAQKRVKDEERDLFLFLLCNYVAWVLNLLNEDQLVQLDGLDRPGQPGWKAHVEAQMHIDRTFVRSVYALAAERMDDDKALAFLLRGLGGEEAEVKFVEVMG